jgi:DSBA-like thioredoxin domain
MFLGIADGGSAADDLAAGVHRRGEADGAAEGAEIGNDEGRCRACGEGAHRTSTTWLARRWSTTDDPDTELGRIAAELGLDRAQFTACLTSRQALERILRDLYDGQALGVKTLPLFILIHGGTGHILTGTRSPEQFAATLQQQLETANSRVTGGGPSARP